MILQERACAKLNLFLHVTGRRADGYHLLETLFAFTDFGDSVRVEPDAPLSLTVSGPFAQASGTGAENSVLKAAMALAHAAGIAPCGALHLDKQLPVAAGIGGGSADAAATLRLLNRVWGLGWPRARLASLALTLGADVPACLAQTAQFGAGIGEDLTPFTALPPLGVVLVNPLVPVPTPAVFKAYAARAQPFSVPINRAALSAGGFAAISRLGNDLEAPAMAVQPVIGDVLAALVAQKDAMLSRMSGSGATCFALFESRSQADRAAQSLRQAHPAWWVRAGDIS
jgi:4-diphosphocytidyl-2-C-methyl-D-erythritol kinase